MSNAVQISQGENRILVCEIRDADGNIVDISTNMIVWRLARNANHEAVVTKTSGGGGIQIEESPTGICEITITGDDSATLLGDYTHELWVYGPDDDRALVLTDLFTVLQDIRLPSS